MTCQPEFVYTGVVCGMPVFHANEGLYLPLTALLLDSLLMVSFWVTQETFLYPLLIENSCRIPLPMPGVHHAFHREYRISEVTGRRTRAHGTKVVAFLSMVFETRVSSE